jgi:hypothetical protein
MYRCLCRLCQSMEEIGVEEASDVEVEVVL